MNVNGNSIEDSNRTIIDLFKSMIKKTVPEEVVDPCLIDDDRYRFERQIGKGASGYVYKAWDRQKKRHVAVKLSKKQTDYMISESRLTGKLEHENIMAIYDSYLGPKFSYIVMEYISGEILENFCRKENILPYARISEIMIGICRGLYYAHDSGIMHLDIKPLNIIINENGVPKIMDFGIARSVEGTQHLGIYGTPSYMSPEYLKTEEVSRASDIFSLGCVLYELLQGEKAFDGETPYTTMYKVMNDDPAPLSTPSPAVAGLFDPIIKKAMSKNPAKRYKDCHEFAYALSQTLPYLINYEKAQKTHLFSSLAERIRSGFKR